MYRLKSTDQDIEGEIEYEATEEGDPVETSVVFESDNTRALSVLQDPNDQKKFKIHPGRANTDKSPATATLKATISTTDDPPVVLKIVADVFMITDGGSEHVVTGGSFKFSAISPEVEPEADPLIDPTA